MRDMGGYCTRTLGAPRKIDSCLGLDPNPTRYHFRTSMSGDLVEQLDNLLELIDDETQFEDIEDLYFQIEGLCDVDTQLQTLFEKLAYEVYCSKGYMCDVRPEIEQLRIAAIPVDN